MSVRPIHPHPLPLPKGLSPTHSLPYRLPNISYLPGQASAIRFFDPRSKSDYLAMKEIIRGKQAKVWMDDPRLSLEDYRDWAGTHTNSSFLFAVHNARAYKRRAAEEVCGFVYLYSEHSEKFRVKRLKKLGLFDPKQDPKDTLEVSFAVRPFKRGIQSGSGLMSSSLRQSCLQVRRLMNRPTSKLVLLAFTDLENLAAQRTLESAGFRFQTRLKYDPDSENESALYRLNWHLLTKKVKGKLLESINQTVNLQPFPQQTDSHCGPAVVQSLLSQFKLNFTQDEIVASAGARSRLKAHGTRPDHLARAVAKLAPKLQFWYKQPANIHDLVALIHIYHVPVAVNWQGLFYDTLEEEKRFNPHGEHGHYSLVTDIDPLKDQITLADPYPDYSNAPRTFSYSWFKTRWWDVDHLYHRKTRKRDDLHTKKLLFIIIPKDADFPAKLHLQLPSTLSTHKQ